MSITADDSSASGAKLGDTTLGRLRAPDVGASQVWLDGDVLSCACPDCGAPMTIRLWLRLAECGMCNARVELSEEVEQLAQQLLERRERGEAVLGGPRPGGPWSRPVRAPALPILSAPKASKPAAPPATPPPPAAAAPPPPPPPAASVPPQPAPVASTPAPPTAATALVAEPVYELADEPIPAQLVAPVAPVAPAASPAFAAAMPVAAPHRAVRHEPSRGLRRQLMRQLIACLISTLFHTLLIVILGMLYVDRIKQPPVYLEVKVPRLADGGPKGSIVVAKPKDDSTGKEPVSISTSPASIGKTLTQEIQTRAEPIQLANRLVVAPSTSLRPSLGGGSSAIGAMLSGRDPTVRARTLIDEGGSDQTELAVAKGLQWLAKHQNRDGSWSLDQFDRAGDCNGRCGETGHHSDTAATALALLPFLGAGHTHRDGPYKETVDRALQWLVQQRDPETGWMGAGAGRMYAHGQVAIALCEAYALTRDSKLRGPAQQAIDFIVAAQHPEGGWRYFPGDPGDMSVVGWQLMALRSAQMSDLKVPKEVIERSNRFLDSVQLSKKIARFAYMPGHEMSETMTAEGMLCRMYAGTSTGDPAITAAADYLLQQFPPAIRYANMYYWYYGTQVMHHLGGSRWKRWNDKMKPLLLKLQDQEGHETGSWKPREYPDDAGGRLYMTALAICTLEVYYRHLPLYKNQALVK